MAFTKAERRKSKVRVWLSGMSSSGKTFSALELCTGFGGRIAMIETEGGRGEMYGGRFDYDVQSLSPPYNPEKYVAAIKEAEKEGYECLVIDSMSHEWSTLLEEKGKIDEKGGNSFTNWNAPTRRHNVLVEALIQSKIPLIVATCRVKRDWVLTENEKGKMEPKLVGLANVQRDGFEYEMSVELRIDKNHEAEALKDNTGLFLGKSPVMLTPEHGMALRAWHNEGSEAKEPETPQPDLYYCVNCTKKNVQSEATLEIDGMKLCKPCWSRYTQMKEDKSLDEAFKK